MANNMVSGYSYRAISKMAEVKRVLSEMIVQGYDEKTGHFDRDVLQTLDWCCKTLNDVKMEVDLNEIHTK